MSRRTALLATIAIVAWVVIGWATPALADNCGDPSDCFGVAGSFGTASNGMLALVGLSLLLDFIPFVGTGKGIIEAITGRDLITGQELAWWERALGVVPVVGGVSSVGGIARAADALGDAGGAARGTDGLDTGGDIARVDGPPAGSGSGPWVDDGFNHRPGGAVSQSTDGSCVSACGEMLTGGTVSEADLLAKLGDWSNPGALARELNQRAGSEVWQGGYFESGADALEAARRGPTAVILQAPGGNAHAVVVEPLESGNFLVRDPLPGQTYEVTSDWIEQYVAGGVFR
jgi:hypothetical protein